MFKVRNLFIGVVLAAILWGCGVDSLDESPSNTITPTLTKTPAPSVTSAPTSTTLPPVGVLLAPPEADQQLTGQIQNRLSQWVPEMGFRFQVLPSLSDEDLERDEFGLVIALSPNSELGDLVVSHPEVQFLAVGVKELEPAPNLTIIGGEGDRLDHQGFIAGYMAAMITPDWRTGVIGSSVTAATVGARQAFITGVKYYCGLCRPSYPPYYEFPLYFELGAEADTTGWQTAAEYMIQRAVETVYIVPGAGDDAMLRYLADAGVNIIAGVPPLPDLGESWVASLRFDLLEAFIDFWPEYIAGSDIRDIVVPLEVVDVNPDILSPGRQHLVDTVLDDVLAGYINLGLDDQGTP
jgi:hypothetical protein